MLKQHSSFVKQAIALVDCLLILGAFSISYFLVSEYRPLATLQNYLLMPIGFMAFYLYFAWTRHLFSILQFNWMKGLNRRILMIFVSAGILGAAILYVMPDNFDSRWLYFIFAMISFVFIFTEKLTLKFVIAYVRRRNRNITPILLFGRGRIASQINKEINAHPEWGLRIVKKLDVSLAPSEFEEVLKTSYIEEVFFCIPRSMTRDGFLVDAYVHICEEIGRPARVFLNLRDITRLAQWEYQTFLEYPTLLSHTVELDPDQIVFKRIFDLFGSLIGVAVLIVLYPILAILIKVTSPGPVFFRQIRVGKNGKRFVIYKFRSMTTDAEARKAELQNQNELNGAVFKIANDPRVTPIGSLMRKLSLDEFPQFINVLKGEMSLVGTRPPTPDEVKEYQNWHHRRISIRPGITGMWQVSGRNAIKDFDEIVSLDLKYIDSWSIWLDIKIIVRTILIVFKRDNAY